VIPGHHRSAADRPAAPPPVPHGTRCVACAIAITVALSSLAIVGAIHLFARIFA
jgi:hypothetical protein